MWDFKLYQNNIALIDDRGTEITYRELEQKCDELYRKIGKRCLCFVLCRNSIDSIVAYTSLIQNNVVALLLSMNIDRGLLNNLLDLYKPSYIISDGEVSPFSNDNYDLYDNLALLLTTSGSTGSPKFVRQSYENISSNAKSIVEYLKLDKSERPITSLPMNYTYGLSIINSHLMVGATICVTDYTLMQKEFWNFFKTKKCTSIAGVPYNYEILDKLRFTRMDLPYLRYMTQAGGKLSLELHKKFANYANDSNKRFVVMYGQCEATARMGYLPPNMALSKIGSMGIAIPGGEFELIDVDGSIIKESDKEGELRYKGDNVTLGYAESGVDLIKADERNGILNTGDIAKRDLDGYYYITGRKKRFLKVYGNRVNLDELERLLKSHFNTELAIGGYDDHIYIFMLKEDNNDSIKEYIEQITNLNRQAFHFKTITEIPHNESGKVLYNELNKLI